MTFKERDVTQTVFKQNGLNGLLTFIKHQEKHEEAYVYLLSRQDRK